MSRKTPVALLGGVLLLTLAWPGVADACWGCRAPRVWYPGPLAVVGCWTPCWTACDVCPPCDLCCDPCCDVGWVLGVRPGPIRRLLFGPYRWYPVALSCCDVCGVSPCACEPVVTSMPAMPPVSPTPAQPAPTPAQPAQPAPGPTPGTQMEPAPFSPTTSLINPTSYSAEPEASIPTRNDSGLITVYVPAEAKVTINGLPTKSAGTRREYVSLGLQPGLQYKYVITAELEKDGKIYEETREVILTAGAKKGVAFSFQFPSENLAGMTGVDRM